MKVGDSRDNESGGNKSKGGLEDKEKNGIQDDCWGVGWKKDKQEENLREWRVKGSRAKNVEDEA